MSEIDVPSAPTSQNQTVPPLVPQSAVVKVAPSNNKKLILGFLAGLVILGLLGAAAFGAYQLGKNQTPNSSTTVAAPSTEVKTPEASPAVTPASDPTVNWQTYENKDALISFKYPPTVTLTSDGKGVTGLVLTVNIEKVSDLPEEAPLNTDRKTAEERQQALSSGKIGQVTAFGGNTTLIQLGKIYGQTSTTFGLFEVCDVRVDKSLIIYNNGYQILISLNADVNEVEKSMPDFFIVDAANCGTDRPIWDRTKDFYAAVVAGKSSAAAQEWYNTFSQILSTFKFL